MFGDRRTRRAGYSCQLRLDDGEALDGVDGDRPTREKREYIPSAIKLRPITARVNIEVTDFAQISRCQVLNFEDPKPPLIVRLVDQIPNDVLVVIDCGNRRQVAAYEDRVCRVEHVPDIGLGVVPKVLLIQFVVHQEIPVIGSEHPLVGVARTGVGRA